MTTLTKFQFDTDFDVPDLDVDAGEEAENEPPPPTFTEADLFAAGEDGFARGREAGAMDTRSSIESAIAAALSVIGDRLGEMGARHQAAWETCQHNALALSAAITRKSVPEIVRARALECIETLVSETLPRLIDEPRVVIRVPDEMLDALQERMRPVANAAGFAGQVILLAEAGLSGPDCRIEWADGGAEFETGRLLQEIDDVIAHHLDGPAPAAEGGGEDNRPEADGEPPAEAGVQADEPPADSNPQETTNG